MSTHDTLAPDQRAVLELVLRQGRSYGELSELLEIPEREVRARADAGLRALAGEPAPSVDSGRIADWLLGQQPTAEADRTQAAIAGNPAAQRWATIAADRLRDLGPADIPAIPDANRADADPDSVKAPRSDTRAPTADDATPDPDSLKAPTSHTTAPTADAAKAASLPAPPPRTAEPRSSKLGGAILLVVVVLIVAAFGIWFLARDDDDTPAADQPAQPTQTATDQPGAPTGNDVALSGPGNSQARGLMRLFTRDDGSVQFAIAAENVPPNRRREVYAVWFTKNDGSARRLGFAQAAVGQDGVLTTGGPQRGDEDKFPRWFATYDKVLVTRESDAKAKKPGPAVLQGTLPGGGG